MRVPLSRLVWSILVHLFQSETATYNGLLDQVQQVYNQVTGPDPEPRSPALKYPDEEVIVIQEEEVREPDREDVIVIHVAEMPGLQRLVQGVGAFTLDETF